MNLGSLRRWTKTVGNGILWVYCVRVSSGMFLCRHDGTLIHPDTLYPYTLCIKFMIFFRFEYYGQYYAHPCMW